MNTLTPHILSDVTLPPVPQYPGSGDLLLWHPVENAFWLLVVSDRQLWRLADDGSGELLASETAIGGPDPRYCHAHAFYYDTARKAPTWLVASYEGLLLATFDGKRFRPVAHKHHIAVASYDSYVFDSTRGVLVHFVASRDADGGKPPREGLTARELGKDGTWRDVGPPIAGEGTDQTFAGWDERRKLAVVISSRSLLTRGWDGKRWHELPDAPDDLDDLHAITIAPRTKALLFLSRRLHGGEPTQLWELGDKRWTARDAAGLEAFGGAAHDPKRDVTVVFGPWFGPGTIQRTLGRFDGKRFVAAGAPSPTFTRGSTSGPAILWGARQPSHNNYGPEMRRPYTALAAARLERGSLVALPPSPPAIGLASTAAGTVCVGTHGHVFRLEKKGWGEPSEMPKGFAPRETTSLGADDEGRLFLVGGDPIGATKRLTDTWLFAHGAWKKLAPKGAAPTAIDADVVFDRTRDTWIVAGGRLKNHKDAPNTHECDGKAWRAFPTRLAGRTGGSLRFVGWDETSAQVFGIGSVHVDECHLFVYRGAGAWGAVASFRNVERGWQSAYDSLRRVVVLASRSTLAEVSIGHALDAARAEQATTAAPAGKRAKEKQPPPTKAAPVVGRPSFHVALGTKGDDTFGGTGPGITAKTWPVCADCKHPMPHVLLLHRHAERLPLKNHAALALFICNGAFTGGTCRTWEPDAGCNEAILLPKKALASKPLARPPSGKNGEAPPKVMRPRRIKYREVFEADPNANDNAEDPKAVTKVGGYPSWIQDEEVPTCRRCKKPHTFVLQLREDEDKALNFGGGDGYLFVCPNEHEAKFFWQR